MSGLMCLEVRKGKRNALVGSDQNWGKVCGGRPGVGSVWRSPWVKGGTGRALGGLPKPGSREMAERSVPVGATCSEDLGVPDFLQTLQEDKE